jgi:AraC-like DNA-binding protein
MATPVRSLDRFPVVRTQNADEMCAALERIYAKPTVHLAAQSGKVDVAINYYPLNYIALGHTKYGVGVSLVYPESDLVLQTFPIRGRGEAVVDATTAPLDIGHGVTVSPHMHFAARLADNYETLLILMKPQILAEKLEAIVGQALSEPLKFWPAQSYAHPAAGALRDHFWFLVEMVGGSPARLPQVLLSEYEETLAVMFLHANRHNHSHLLERAVPDIAPRQLAHAEEYIEANADRVPTVEELASVTGVSVLSLYRALRKTRGLSPMEFAKRLRLRRARDLLRCPDADTSVASAAFACGYCDLARFDSDYLSAFGEPPQQTLLRGRGGPSTRH